MCFPIHTSIHPMSIRGETRIFSVPKTPYFEYVILNSIQGPEGSSLLGISSETGRANIGKIPHLGI